MKKITFFVATILFAFIHAPAFGENPFTASTSGDYGNVTVMEVTGNYDANNADGTVNAGPRQVIAREFYRLHKDEYDFLVIFTNFDFTMPKSDVVAFYTGVKNDTKGIGVSLFDNSHFYGSQGKLQGTIDMGNMANLVIDPLDPGYEETLDTISHEMMHRWAAFPRFRDSLGNLSPALLGKDNSHWSFLLSTDASLMYGNTWQENGNKTFTSIKGEKYYSPLDLYLMGFLDKSQVPPMLLIDNPDVDPLQESRTDVTISGTPRYISIDDIIAAEGERIPGAADAQRTFKTAFILVTPPGTYSGDELPGLENIRNGWITRYSVLTDGAGLLQVASTLNETLPVNPGVTPPVIIPRTSPSTLDDGVAWLITKQQADGSWMDLLQTAERDTAEVVVALKQFDVAGPNYSAGLEWLGVLSAGSTDYIARAIEALANAGQNSVSLMSEIASRQNGDGGWGSARNFASNPADTGLVLKALGKAGYSAEAALTKAIQYLKAAQNADGGWGNEEGSRVETTSAVLSPFNGYKGTYALDDQITSGVSWLLQRQNSDGGFGNSPTTVYAEKSVLSRSSAISLKRSKSI